MKVIMLKISQMYNEKKIQKRNNNKKHNVNTIESFSFIGVNVRGGKNFPSSREVILFVVYSG